MSQEIGIVSAPFVTGFREPMDRLRAHHLRPASSDSDVLAEDAFLPREGSRCAKESKEGKDADGGSLLALARGRQASRPLLSAAGPGEHQDLLGRGDIIV